MTVRPFFLSALAMAVSVVAQADVPGRNLPLLAHFNDYPPQAGYAFGAGYASCWSYIHGDGREYAVIGTYKGTAFYNVTDPANSYRVGFIPSKPSTWHEMKQYRNWIYVVTEANAAIGDTIPAGVQIIRMTDPEHPVLAATYAQNFHRSHTVSVDTARAILICNGTTYTPPSGGGGGAAGMRFLSLANPEAPVEIGWWPGGAFPVSNSDYVHDSVPVGSRLYASSIYAGIQRILDFTNPAATTQIAAWTYPRAFYTHNGWPDKTGRYVYVTDEQNGQTLRVFDIANPTAPALVYEYTANAQAIAHNVHALGDELYVAHYTEGIRILDISDPAHPAEFAWADTYPGTSGSYFGVWGVCPYFPSGTVIASDMQTGLYVFRPVRDYGLLGVRAVDGTSQQPMAGVTIRLTSTGDSLTTPADGLVRFAPNPGSHTAEIRHFGFEPVLATRQVLAGGKDTVRFALTRKPTANLTGIVRDVATQAPLADAEVILAYTPVQERSDPSGNYALIGIPEDVYRVEVRRAGYVPIAFVRRIGPGFEGSQDFWLNAAATWDPLEAESGWTVGAGDDATGGAWTRVAPTGTGAAAGSFASAYRSSGVTSRHVCGAWDGPSASDGGASAAASASGMACSTHGGVSATGDGADEPVGHCGCGTACLCAKASAALGEVQPGSDHTPGSGTQCFITGQATDGTPGGGDVDGGRTTLTSPAFNVGGLSDPVIGFWRWFYTNGDANDWLAILISNDNGATWVPVDTTRGLHNEWQEQAIQVAAHVTPTSQVRIRMVAADLGPESVVEAAMDDVLIYDGPLTPVSVGPEVPPARMTLRAPRPNPAGGPVMIELELPRAGAVAVEVFDLGGRRVRTLHRGSAPAGVLSMAWDGLDDSGRAVAEGIYYARAAAGTQQTGARIAIVR